MKTIKDRREDIESKIKEIQRKADNKKVKLYEQLGELRIECRKKGHGSTHGDAYDDWCDGCGERV